MPFALLLAALLVAAPAYSSDEGCVPGIDVVTILDDSKSIQDADPNHDRRWLITQLYAWLATDILYGRSGTEAEVHRLGVIRAARDIRPQLPLFDASARANELATIDSERIHDPNSLQHAIERFEEQVAGWSYDTHRDQGSEFLPALLDREQGVLSSAYLGGRKECAKERSALVVLISDGEVQVQADTRSESYREGLSSLGWQGLGRWSSIGPRPRGGRSWKDIAVDDNISLLVVLLKQDETRYVASDGHGIEYYIGEQRKVWEEMSGRGGLIPTRLDSRSSDRVASFDVSGVSMQVHEKLVDMVSDPQTLRASVPVVQGQSSVKIDFPPYADLVSLYGYAPSVRSDGADEGPCAPDWTSATSKAELLLGSETAAASACGSNAPFVYYHLRPTAPSGASTTLSIDGLGTAFGWGILALAQIPQVEVVAEPLDPSDPSGPSLIEQDEHGVYHVSAGRDARFSILLRDGLSPTGEPRAAGFVRKKPPFRVTVNGQDVPEALTWQGREESQREGHVLSDVDAVGAFRLDISKLPDELLEGDPVLEFVVGWNVQGLLGQLGEGDSAWRTSDGQATGGPSVDPSAPRASDRVEIAPHRAPYYRLCLPADREPRPSRRPRDLYLDTCGPDGPVDLGGGSQVYLLRIGGPDRLETLGEVEFTPYGSTPGRLLARLPGDVPLDEVPIFLFPLGRASDEAMLPGECALTLPAVSKRWHYMMLAGKAAGLALLGFLFYLVGPDVLGDRFLARLRPSGRLQVHDALGLVCWESPPGGISACARHLPRLRPPGRWSRTLPLGRMGFEFRRDTIRARRTVSGVLVEIGERGLPIRFQQGRAGQAGVPGYPGYTLRYEPDEEA